MAKNTGNYKFRKIDVDQYSEDKYEDVDTDDGPQGPNENEVSGLLAQGKNVAALELVLNNAPVGTKNQAIKDKAAQLTLRVLLSFKSADMEGALKNLNSPQIDLLMKYIYRGFESPSDNSSATLLSWHEKVFALGGSGCIVRVLTDRKKV